MKKFLFVMLAWCFLIPCSFAQSLTFNGHYQFNPPQDHFFITVTNMADNSYETYVKIGPEEAYTNGKEIDRFWSNETGANWFYVPDSQGWTDDVNWEFEPFGESFFPLYSFAHEAKTDSDLTPYYKGTEKVMGIDCWVFLLEFPEDGAIRYWVDPSNGCTLRRQVNDRPAYEVTTYNLSYSQWDFGPNLKKSFDDTTR